MITDKVREILEEFEQSGSFETLMVANVLKEIASNGEEQDKDEYLVMCAGEIRDAAQAFISRMQAPTGKDLWADDPEYPRVEWKQEVINGDTQLGYHAWREHRKELS